jgi:DNA-binding transcriptional regulator/RsmH inhibitor MraZ
MGPAATEDIMARLDLTPDVMDQRIEAALANLDDCKPSERRAVVRMFLAEFYRKGIDDAKRCMLISLTQAEDNANVLHASPR